VRTTTTTASPTGLPSYRRSLPRTAPSAGRARDLVRCALAGWGLDELADAGALLVSELVGNAVRHTRCRLIEVTLTRPEPSTVRIAVADRSHVPPVLRTRDDGEPGGRGLVIVEALTASWGTEPLPWGKRVWGELVREDTG
jgi:anti-sigma regulatory factor (Ser/Thr protein kinase)